MAINLRQKLDVIIGFAQDLRDDLCERDAAKAISSIWPK